jgi:putative tryptophan/tyrosine transport system substrate-binding protein
MRRREFIAGVGSAAAWPLAAQAQQRTMPVVGVLSVVSIPPAQASSRQPFRQGLREQGYVVGQNLAIEYRFSGQGYDQLLNLAAELVQRQVAVIVAFGTGSALAAKAVTTTVPIVGMFGTDPVDVGAVSSLNRPAGNITGVYYLDQALTAKRFQLLHEIAPSARSIGLLAKPAAPVTEAAKRDAEAATRTLGVQLAILDASTPGEIEAAFAMLAGQQIGALVVGIDFAMQLDQLVALAARTSIPAIYSVRAAVKAGGLMSYGGQLDELARVAGSYVGRILKGEKPADLPVQQAVRVPRHQPQDRQSPRPHHPGNAVGHRRRGDPIAADCSAHLAATSKVLPLAFKFTAKMVDGRALFHEGISRHG